MPPSLRNAFCSVVLQEASSKKVIKGEASHVTPHPSDLRDGLTKGGKEVASRVGKLSKGRNSVTHPDTRLLLDLVWHHAG